MKRRLAARPARLKADDIHALLASNEMPKSIRGNSATPPRDLTARLRDPQRFYRAASESYGSAVEAEFACDQQRRFKTRKGYIPAERWALTGDTGGPEEP
jgi:hypothetical protein